MMRGSEIFWRVTRGLWLTTLRLLLFVCAASVWAQGAGRPADGRSEWRQPTGLANQAPVLGTIGDQALVVGRAWRLYLRGRDPDGAAPLLSIEPLLKDAAITVRDDGWYVLSWTPRAGDEGVVELLIIATDAVDATLQIERRVRLEIVSLSASTGANEAMNPAGRSELPQPSELPVPSEPPQSPRPSEPSELREPTESLDLFDTPGPSAIPVIDPLAAQIVSAGRTVSYRVSATLADGRTASLAIDRLPRNASFDMNSDGSRTLHWPTGDGDQGEHRFRLTATDPDDTRYQAQAPLLVVVGDPTRSNTVPAGEGVGASEIVLPSTDTPLYQELPDQESAADEKLDEESFNEFLPDATITNELAPDYDPADYPDENLGYDSEQRDVAGTEPDLGPDGLPSDFPDDSRDPYEDDLQHNYFDDPGGSADVESSLGVDPAYVDTNNVEAQMDAFDEEFNKQYGDGLTDDFSSEADAGYDDEAYDFDVGSEPLNPENALVPGSDPGYDASGNPIDRVR